MADIVLSRELKSLQEEVAAARQERLASPSASPAVALPNSPERIEEIADERELRDQLGQLANEVTGFFEEAEKNIAAHPTQSVIGALLVGILIGRLLGRG